MKCFVTGGSGFVGSNLIHELLARGHRVKALLRPNADLRPLAGAQYERVTGDLSDPALLQREMVGCDWCFHTAASYYLWLRDYQPMYDTNVTGTRNVLEAAGKAGCSRIVYTSTVGCIGLSQLKNSVAVPVPADEEQIVTRADLSSHYKLSKWQGEEIAMKLARAGLPIVVVNPSAPVGPRDMRPTPTGQFVMDFLNRKLPAYIDTGLNWIHVRDVVIGHILAAEKGRVGERYILANAQGNWTMHETTLKLQEFTGIPAPRFEMPGWLALASGYVSEAFSAVTGMTPAIPLGGVRMAQYKMWFNPAKAVRELGLPQTPPMQALADSVEWFRANGYVKAK
jgi:dihydroflavonol-4-reductase